MTYEFKKPENDYDPILDGGRGFNSSAAADDVYNEFDRSVIFKNPEFIDALDDIRPIEQFEKDHPNFKMDVYMEICNQVYDYEKKIIKFFFSISN